MDRRSSIPATGLLLLVLLSGCSDRLATTPVGGTITLADGEPLVGATVSMESLDKSTSATGRTDGAGRFFMGTYESDDGLPLGTYRVVVLPPPSPDPDAPSPAQFDSKYSSYESSGLEFTIDGAVDDLKIQLD